MRRVTLLAVVVFASRVLPAQQVDTHSIPAKSRYNLESFAGKRPLTRAERTNFTETSHYDDVVAFIDSLKALGAKISTGSIAKTVEGRELPYVIASRPLITTPAEARRQNRPVAYIQANIHAGEVEGKEAMQSLLRDLLFDKKKNVLDSIVLIVQPDYNADGNEHFGLNRIGSQNGPEQTGTRTTSCGWNLNRDYISAVQNSDVRRFDEILAEDFLCSNPDGSLVDRAGFLVQTARPVTISNLEARDVRIRIMGDVAIIHARTTYTMPDGRAASGRYTDVWARRQGRWLAVSAHVTRC